MFCVLPTVETFKNLSEDNIFTAVAKICKSLINCGAQPYFVGGCVRDAILGLRLSDFDIEVFGTSIDNIENILSKEFGVEKTGQAFCVLKIKGLPIDISVPREEIKIGNKHTEFSVKAKENCDIKTAASRRDFTINSIYFDVANGKIVDEFGGLKDLQTKTLRHVSEKFSEDPLRVLRGMQLAGRFSLKAAEDTLNLCKNLSIDGISRERIFAEWEKLLIKSEKPSFGLYFLEEAGWLKFFKEIDELVTCMQDLDQHPEGSVFNHTCLALDAFARTRIGNREEDLILGFTTLCHDFGKPCSTTVDARGIHHYGHEETGIPLSEKFLKGINAPNYLVEAVLPLVRWHMTPRNLYRFPKNQSQILHLANDVGRIDRLIRICYNDSAGRGGFDKKHNSEIEDWLGNTAKALGVFSNKPAPLVQGRDLLALGLNPSAKFSEILNNCFEAQLDCKFLDHASGIAYLKKIIHDRSSREDN